MVCQKAVNSEVIDFIEAHNNFNYTPLATHTGKSALNDLTPKSYVTLHKHKNIAIHIFFGVHFCCVLAVKGGVESN